MAQKAETAVERRVGYEYRPEWVSGVIAGLVGGAVMGVLFSVLTPPVIEAGIPALFGLSGGLAGWLVHMSLSAVFGVGFAALVTLTPLSKDTDTPLQLVGAGLLYGAVLWIVAAAVVMPLWLTAVGFPMAPPLPNLDAMSLVGHLAFGTVVGLFYSYA
ncbi:histidine kinase [Halorientalis pallida]|uniref:Histidine kinase n=1 Tax=Halorientalis pallida TaxID=2479928 RepID=A0A498KXQ4_9EURY|nr:histidine kinase [Halorientalis pallida]RXK50402.1 histidine kinase [Halorientalis pallida]